MFQNIKQVLELDLHPPPIKYVLVVIASHADSKGYCYPGIDLLASETGYHRRTVMRATKQLADLGLIEITTRSTRNGRISNAYQLRLGQQGDTESLSNQQHDTESPCPPAQQNGTLTLAKKKKLEIDYEAYQLYWNANAPAHWSQCQSMNKERKRLVNTLIKDVGADHALDVFAAAIDYAKNDDWWGKLPAFTIQNLLTKGKAVDFAEKWVATRGTTSQQLASAARASSYYDAIMKDDYGKN